MTTEARMAVASMPMYDMPEIEAALEDLWAGFTRHFARHGIADAPGQLSHGWPLRTFWDDPELWFSQCCGYDLLHSYAGRLRPLATPHFDAPGCVGRDYTSLIVVAEDSQAQDVSETRGAVCAVNGMESHSGMNALRALVAPAAREGRFFAEVKVSGRHADSLAMIRAGAAEIAAIDCVTHALLARHRPDALAGTRVIGRAALAPGIPYVTQAHVGDAQVERLRAGILDAFADADLAAAREAVLLRDVEATTLADYAPIDEFAAIAARHGYPELR